MEGNKIWAVVVITDGEGITVAIIKTLEFNALRQVKVCTVLEHACVFFAHGEWPRAKSQRKVENFQKLEWLNNFFSSE